MDMDKIKDNIKAVKNVDNLLDGMKDAPVWADDYWIDPRVDYPEPQYSLYQGETGFMPVGDFQLIKAKKKSGKTYLCSIYAASILGCKDFGFTSVTTDPKVIIFDTEQSKENAARVERRIRKLAGIDQHVITQKINAYDLRPLTAINRLDYIKSKMDVIKPTHVFIDGIVDLGYDYMQSDKSTELMTRLLAMTKGADYSCSIVGVLHTNKSDDDHNGRGFLGTEGGNKASEETEIVKRKDTNSIFDVTMTDCRNRPITPWSFSIDAHGMPFRTNNVKDNEELAKLNAMSELMKKSFDTERELTTKELIERIETYAPCKERAAYKKLKSAMAANLVCAVNGKNHVYRLAN